MRPLPAILLVASMLAITAHGADNIIRIATVSPLSGSEAGLGEMIKLGAQEAIDEAKPDFEKRGFQLEFEPQDDQASPDVGVAVARRMVNDPALLAVVGHLNSGVAIPSSEVYKDYQLVMVSPANSNPNVTDRGYPNVNRVCGRDDIQGPVGADFAVKELKAKHIFVVHDKTAYGQGIAETFRARATELGATIVGFVGSEEKANFQSLILQMKMLKPDLVYFGGIYDQGGVLVKQMREKGIMATFLGPDALDSSEFVKIAQGATVGVYYTTIAGPVDQYPNARHFALAFQDQFKKPAESYALYAYDAANVVLTAILAAADEKNGQLPTREEVSQAVRNVSLHGITGTIEFDGKGDRKMSDYFIIEMKEAKYPGTAIRVISASPPSK